MIPHRPLFLHLLVPALPLLAPLIAMQFTNEVHWTGSDFVTAYVLLAGTGFAFRFITRGAAHPACRLGAGLLVLGCLSLLWVNLAVGLIGSEDNPANLLYSGVIAICAFGAVLSRGAPRGMARVGFAAAVAQFTVPILAFLLWRPGFDAGGVKIFLLNSVWSLLFLVAGLLFRHTARAAAGSSASTAP